MTKDKIVYEIEVPTDQRSAIDETPSAYRVVVPYKSACCCIVYGRYHNRWKANVSCRWLVMHLLGRCDKLEEACRKALDVLGPEKIVNKTLAEGQAAPLDAVLHLVHALGVEE